MSAKKKSPPEEKAFAKNLKSVHAVGGSTQGERDKHRETPSAGATPSSEDRSGVRGEAVKEHWTHAELAPEATPKGQKPAPRK